MINVTDNIIYINKSILNFTSLKFPEEDGNYMLTNKELSKLPHDCLCEELFPGIKSDSKLSKIKNLNDEFDDLTPDYIFIDSDSVLVVEVKTCFFEEMIESKKKFIKELYEVQCSKRCAAIGKNLKLSHLVVSRSKVDCSFDVNDSKLIDLYNKCMNIKMSSKNLGWNYEETDNYIENRDELMRNIRKIQINEESQLPEMSMSHINCWLSMSEKMCHDSSVSLFKNSVLTSSKEVNKSARMSKNERDTEYKKSCEFQESEYWNEHDNHYNSFRTDLKAPVQVPLFLCKPCVESYSDLDRILRLRHLIIRGNSAIAQIWREAINSSCENSSAYEPIVSNLTKSEKKMRRSKHFRVRPKVSSEVSIRLACSGIE
jgi:hypothetical protein